VIVEPIQASHGGYEATRDFYQSLHKLCAETGTLLVFDEILTGLWRTGEPFYFRGQGLRPDVVLIGKGLGGGFPVSAVVVDQNIAIEPRMLPTSTFAGNSLAAAAAAAALGEMRRMELPARVAAIAMCVRESLDPLAQHGVALRGRGALWVLEMPAGVDMPRLLKDVYEHGVAIGGAGRFIRLLPAATIVPENLRQACEVLSNAILRQLAERHA
jgi:acetylornithine/succinyldiaminopimelate/putrescine aminotransferase